MKLKFKNGEIPQYLLKSFLVMRITLFFILISSAFAFSSNSYAQNAKLSLRLNNATVKEVLRSIEDQSEFIFFYQDQQIDLNRKVDILVEDKNIDEILNQLFAGTANTYIIRDRQVTIGKSQERLENKGLSVERVLEGAPQPHKKIISGTVKDSNGLTLPGVSVVILGTTTGVSTDNNGNFTLSNVPDNSTLKFSFVGMKSQVIKIENQTSLNVVLSAESYGIDEVVAIGYGTQKKKDVIGSISSVNADDIMRTGAPSFDSALQGIAAGVQINTESGVPGAPVSVLIRGLGSISLSRSPLWVVDGIPVINGATGPSYDGETAQNVFSMINPSDIENIEVLKDAAATSIYGSRGSNGVIIVTTKSGKKGETRVSVDIKSGVSQWAKQNIGLANSSQYMQIMDLARTNSNISGQYTPLSSLNQLDGVVATLTRDQGLATNTNWADVISRKGSFYDASVALKTGTEKGNSYLSLRYREENGNLKFNNLTTFSANVNLNYNITKSFTLGYKINASLTNNNRDKSSDGKSGAGGWAQITSNSLPWMPVYDPNGVNGFWNPLCSANALAGISPLDSESTLESLNLISSLNATWKLPLKGLSLQGLIGGNLMANKALSWRSAAIDVNGAIADESKYNTSVLNYNTYLNYDNKIGENHDINVVAGVENTRSISHTMSLEGTQLNGIYHEVGTPGLVTGCSLLGGESYLRGYFGRINYKLSDKYLIGASIRRDGISQFSPKNRWATFASGSLGWVISDEKFFKVDAISLLKLRGSYGQTGNTNVPNGITQDQYTIRPGGSNSLQGTPSTMLQNIGNSDIKWETTSTYDFGFDFGLFKNRINGSVAYYKQRISNLLLATALPLSAGIEGGTVSWENIGKMENKGFEFNVQAVVINKAVKWSVGGNLATNNNKVLALDRQSDANGVGILIYDQDGVNRRITKTGYGVQTWYMAESAGVDVQKGIPLIYEVKTNADGSTTHTGNIIPGTLDNVDANQMILKGKSQLPKIVGGFNTNVAFKNFDLNMVWSFALGNYIYNATRQSLLTPNRGVLQVSTELLTSSWQKPGDHAKLPQVVSQVEYLYDDQGNATTSPVPYGSDNTTPSSMYLEKGDYFRLRNLQLGYTFPGRMINKVSLQNLRIYVSGNNLLTITKFKGYDPEAGGFQLFNPLPQSKSFMLGMNVNF